MVMHHAESNHSTSDVELRTITAQVFVSDAGGHFIIDPVMHTGLHLPRKDDVIVSVLGYNIINGKEAGNTAYACSDKRNERARILKPEHHIRQKWHLAERRVSRILDPIE